MKLDLLYVQVVYLEVFHVEIVSVIAVAGLLVAIQQGLVDLVQYVVPISVQYLAC